MSRLTPKQNEVYKLLACGLTNKEIGIKLGITEATVKVHVIGILKKMGARNRAHATYLFYTEEMF